MSESIKTLREMQKSFNSANGQNHKNDLAEDLYNMFKEKVEHISERSVRVITGGRISFEKELDKALKEGYIIPPTESMKATENGNYHILVVKRQENDKKFI